MVPLVGVVASSLGLVFTVLGVVDHGVTSMGLGVLGLNVSSMAFNGAMFLLLRSR